MSVAIAAATAKAKTTRRERAMTMLELQDALSNFPIKLRYLGAWRAWVARCSVVIDGKERRFIASGVMPSEAVDRLLWKIGGVNG